MATKMKFFKPKAKPRKTIALMIKIKFKFFFNFRFSKRQSMARPAKYAEIIPPIQCGNFPYNPKYWKNKWPKPPKNVEIPKIRKNNFQNLISFELLFLKEKKAMKQIKDINQLNTKAIGS